MKVLLLGHGRLFDPSRVVTGSDQRTHALAGWIESIGGQRFLAVPEDAAGDLTPKSDELFVYSSPGELSRFIGRGRPDVIIVGLWNLLGDLPDPLSVPVVVDLVAPRILESLYEPRNRQSELARLLRLLRRGDRFLVGSYRQYCLQIGLLMSAGFDLAHDVPMDVVALTGETRSRGPEFSASTPLRFVSGGVQWPWRRDQNFLSAFARAMPEPSLAGKAELCLMRGGGESSSQNFQAGNGSWLIDSGLLPYQEMAQRLEKCHIGIEVSEANIEREFSRSFRLVEYLTRGLPVIVNKNCDLAEAITTADAGWAVSSPEEFVETAKAIVTRFAGKPEEYGVCSDNALALARRQFAAARNFAPLGRFLQHPKPARLGPTVLDAAQPGNGPSTGRATARLLLGSLKTRAGRLFWKFLVLGLRPFCLRGQVDWLMVTRSDLFPANHGAAVKIVKTAEGISRQAGTLMIVTDNPRHYHVFENGTHRVARYPWWIRLLRSPAFVGNARLRARGIPINELLLYRPLIDRSLNLRTLFLAVNNHVPIFHAEFPAYARPCIFARNLLGGHAMLVEHNVEYQRIAQQYPKVGNLAGPYLRDVEISLANQCDAVVAVSEVDATVLRQDGVDEHRLTVIPHGVDLTLADSVEPIDVRSTYDLGPCDSVLVFHGQYGYRPNLEAVTLIADTLLPRWEAMGLDVKVLAVGPEPPPRRLHPRLVFTGPVDEVAPVLKGCDLAVIPLQEGGGTRMKVLDYFAVRVPVLITSKGVEGIPVTHGQELWIEDDLDQMAMVAAQLLSRDSEVQSVVEAAYGFVADLDWRRIGVRYVNLFSGSGSR